MKNQALVNDECMSCGKCVELCPVGCIEYPENTGGGYNIPVKDLDICTDCGECLEDCPAV